MSEEKKTTAQMSSEANNALTEIAKKKAMDYEAIFMKDIVMSTDALRNTIPENVFVTHFLPFFSGNRNSQTDNDVVAKWIAVAGTPMAEVNVMDDSGEVIYTVPPLLDTSIIDVVKRSAANSLSNIYTNKEVHSRNIPAAGETYLMEALDEKTRDVLKPSEHASEYEKRWANIFSRYGIQMPEGEKAQESATKSNEGPEELEYD